MAGIERAINGSHVIRFLPAIVQPHNCLYLDIYLTVVTN